jgi:hypothetical protein
MTSGLVPDNFFELFFGLIYNLENIFLGWLGLDLPLEIVPYRWAYRYCFPKFVNQGKVEVTGVAIFTNHYSCL